MTRQELADRILQGDEHEDFTVIVISQQPEHLGFASIALVSTRDNGFLKDAVDYAHFALSPAKAD